jgi:hypothetical protein
MGVGSASVVDYANTYPAFAAIDGYHVNVRAGEEIPVLDTYKIEPKTPSRVWA